MVLDASILGRNSHQGQDSTGRNPHLSILRNAWHVQANILRGSRGVRSTFDLNCGTTINSASGKLKAALRCAVILFSFPSCFFASLCYELA